MSNCKTDRLMDQLMLPMWPRTAKELDTNRIAGVHMDRSESRWIPRSLKYLTGWTVSKPTINESSEQWRSWRADAYLHRISVFSVLSCSGWTTSTSRRRQRTPTRDFVTVLSRPDERSHRSGCRQHRDVTVPTCLYSPNFPSTKRSYSFALML